jgi:glutamine synthetase
VGDTADGTRGGAEAARTPQEARWLRERAYLQEHRHGLAVRAAGRYPADARLAGTPLLTVPAWRPVAPVPLEKIALTLRPEPFGGQYPGIALPGRADGSRYASYSQAMGELDAPAVFENRPVYRLSQADLAGDRPSLEFGLGRYFDLIDTGTAAAHELAARELAVADSLLAGSLLTDSAVADAAASTPTIGTLPVRTAIGDPCDPGKRPVIMAVATLTLRLDRAAGTVRFPLHWRDPGKVGHAGGMYMVVPAGIFQPSGAAAWNVRNDFDLWKCMVREYAEELLGADEDHGSERVPIDYDAWPFAARMTAARDRGQVRAWCVGLGVDPLTFATDLLTVTVFDAAAYDEIFGGLVRENAEGTVLAARDLDEATVAELTGDRPVHSSPGGTTAVSLRGMQAAGAALLALAFRHRGLLCGLAFIPGFRDSGEDESMDAKDVVSAALRGGAKLVRFEYCDVSGVARTKAVHLSQLERKLTEGVSLTRAQMAINLLEQLIHVEGMEPVGEIRLVPDPDTFTVLPWAPASGSVLCDQLGHDRADWGACPRSYLKSVVKRASRLGLRVQAAFENEYYLAREDPGSATGFAPYDVPSHAPVYSSIGHDFSAALMVETTDALEAQGLIVEQAINEYGAGQQEISIQHADALTAADNQMKFRDTVRGVALGHGLLASFAPKPFPDQIGSGAHVHFSLWDGERSVLYDAGAPGGLSPVGRHFIAGVVEHLPALVALTAPSFNSYSRLRPSAWASATTAWGFDNKEAALRVCSPFYQRAEGSYNIEFKAADASANPYLALGALIACGLDGIERSLEPAEPAGHDPARMTAGELARAGVRPLPASMGAALDELAADKYLLDGMGDLLARCYLTVRRSEATAFAARDKDFEIRHHFYRF